MPAGAHGRVISEQDPEGATSGGSSQVKDLAVLPPFLVWTLWEPEAAGCESGEGTQRGRAHLRVVPEPHRLGVS